MTPLAVATPGGSPAGVVSVPSQVRRPPRMPFRDWVHGAGRVLTRGLLHPRVRHLPLVSDAYCRLYLLGKRLTDRHELSTIRSLIQPGMVIADIGANVGFYTVEMARS